ncbi:MAG: hypothetical protein QXR24_06925, partial [Thermosphaera sp.]
MRNKTELSMIDKFTIKVLRPLKNVMRDILRYWTGRVGLIILLFLIAVSIYAVLALPAGFISRWESAAYWDENPQWSPPTWVSVFGIPVAKSSIIVKSTPDEPLSVWENRFVAKYIGVYELEDPAFPQDLSIKLIGLKIVNLSGVTYSPHLQLIVKRPDGSVIYMFESDILIGVGETIDLVTTRDVKPDIYDLRRISESLISYYNFTMPEEITGYNSTLQRIGESIIAGRLRDEVRLKRAEMVFSIPVISISKKDQSLQVNQILITIDSLVNRINDTTEETSWVKEALLFNKEEINSLLTENATLSEFLETLERVRNNLTQVWKKAFMESILPTEQLSEIESLIRLIGKYIEQLYSTDSFYEIKITTSPLTGKYEFILTISYMAKVDLKEYLAHPVKEVRIIIKGNAYGVLGTDDLGRDLYQVLIYGTPIALAIGLTTAIITTFLGVFAGITSGYYGGFID